MGKKREFKETMRQEANIAAQLHEAFFLFSLLANYRFSDDDSTDYNTRFDKF